MLTTLLFTADWILRTLQCRDLETKVLKLREFTRAHLAKVLVLVSRHWGQSLLLDRETLVTRSWSWSRDFYKGLDINTAFGITLGHAQTCGQYSQPYLQEYSRMQPRTTTTVSTCLSYLHKYDTRCYFNVRSKADMSQLNLLHGNDN